MSLVYLFLKIYPFFSVSLMVLAYDLTRNFRRRGIKAWPALALICLFFALTTALWFYFKGYRNADVWFGRFSDWLHHG